MDRKETIFRAFLTANNLRAAPDFGNHTVLYQGGLFPKPMSPEQIKGTLEFAAFVDGIEQKPCRFDGPLGTAKQQADEETRIDDIVDTLAHGLGADKVITRKLLKDISSGLNTSERDDTLQRLHEVLPRSKYDSQYRLGMNCTYLLRT